MMHQAMADAGTERERCLREIAEAVRNQRQYPEEKMLAVLGEMDWRCQLAILESEK